MVRVISCDRRSHVLCGELRRVERCAVWRCLRWLHLHAEHALLHVLVWLATMSCPVRLYKASEMRVGLVRRIGTALVALTHGAALRRVVCKTTGKPSVARVVLP